jgi:hypothetical protein
MLENPIFFAHPLKETPFKLIKFVSVIQHFLKIGVGDNTRPLLQNNAFCGFPSFMDFLGLLVLSLP